MKYNSSGWLFTQDKLTNDVHDITYDDIDSLIRLSLEDNTWSQDVKKQVKYFDKIPGGEIILNQLRIMNVAGTTVTFPFGDIITFDSKRHFFRGENSQFEMSVPTLNRKIMKMSPIEQELFRAVSNMRIVQFRKFIWNINVVPYWEAKISDVNYTALAQHYGFDTPLLDLTNDFLIALFFATCKYDKDTDSYKPLSKEDIEKSDISRYGIIFHSPNWMLDYMNGTQAIQLHEKMMQHDWSLPFNIDSGELDGVAFQIGYQPFYRCHFQSGYIYPMRENMPLQQDIRFEKLRFKQSPELSQKVYELMQKGKLVYPSEGISEARDILTQIQNAVEFSEDDLLWVYDINRVDRNLFPTLESFREAILEFSVNGKKIHIQPNEIKYHIGRPLLRRINKQYDNKDLLKPIGGILHHTSEQRRFREERCKEIYGKLI